MANNIKLVTYTGSSVSPKHDAIIQNITVPGNGMIYGGSISKKSNNTLHVNAGMGMIYGREFELVASDIHIQLSSSGVLNGRIYIHMDLGNTEEPIVIGTESASTLRNLVDNPNVNLANGVTEMELATFKVGTSDISELNITVEKLPSVTEMIQNVVKSLENSINTKAKKNHASTSNEYGLATESEFGHVRVVASHGLNVNNGFLKMETASTSEFGATKLSSSTSSTSESLAATSKAVKSAYDLAKSASVVAEKANPMANVFIGSKTVTATSCGTGTTTEILSQSLSPGTYILFASIYVNRTSSDNGYVDLHIANGSTKLASARAYERESAIQEMINVSAVVQLAATSSIKLLLSNATGTTFTNNSDAYLSSMRWARLK